VTLRDQLVILHQLQNCRLNLVSNRRTKNFEQARPINGKVLPRPSNSGPALALPFDELRALMLERLKPCDFSRTGDFRVPQPSRLSRPEVKNFC
jgi:hypothetical protein